MRMRILYRVGRCAARQGRKPITNRLPRTYIVYSGYMDNDSAMSAFGALAQATRLDTFRLLVRHEPDGLAAVDIARQLNVPQNTMSAHLAILSRAGVVQSERHSRSII
jgi:ArsR family transcriptional regulator